jgi:threonine synthase
MGGVIFFGGNNVSVVKGLQCRECAREVAVGPVHVCEFCFGPLEVVYDREEQRRRVSREAIAAGPDSLWRYADLLPVLPGATSDERVDLGAGLTPLVRAPRLGEALGLRDLWLKNDTLNPTNSFKDRVVSVALTAARRLGMTTFACASTGNLAQSVAAHAARAGMDSCVLIPSNLEEAKILATAVYGTRLVAVEGNYDDVNRLCGEIASEHDGWGFVNVNLRPYYAEGSKTLGFEVAEQLGWQLPDHIVAPMASGSMLVKIDKAFRELIDLELVAERPWRVSGAQATGCSPIAAAFKGDTGAIRPVRPDTIAKSLAIGDPADGYYALDVVRRTGGAMEDVSDAEIADAILLLAQTEGIFAETAGGVTVAVLAKLAAAGAIDPDGRTVAIISGHGLKTLPVLAGRAGPTHTVAPSLDAFHAALELTEALT